MQLSPVLRYKLNIFTCEVKCSPSIAVLPYLQHKKYNLPNIFIANFFTISLIVPTAYFTF